VRSKKVSNPYGICTKSVYGSRGIKKKSNIGCTKSYELKNLKRDQLILLAKEKKINIYKNNKGYLKKQTLIEMLYSVIKKKDSK